MERRKFATYEEAERVAIKMEADPIRYPGTRAGEELAVLDMRREAKAAEMDRPAKQTAQPCLPGLAHVDRPIAGIDARSRPRKRR